MAFKRASPFVYSPTKDDSIKSVSSLEKAKTQWQLVPTPNYMKFNLVDPWTLVDYVLVQQSSLNIRTMRLTSHPMKFKFICNYNICFVRSGFYGTVIPGCLFLCEHTVRYKPYAWKAFLFDLSLACLTGRLHSILSLTGLSYIRNSWLLISVNG